MFGYLIAFISLFPPSPSPKLSKKTAVVEEQCADDNSGTLFALMFLDTEPTDRDIDLFITSTMTSQQTLVTLSTPANPSIDLGVFAYTIDPLSSIIVTLPAALKLAGNVRSDRGVRLVANGAVTVHGVNTEDRGACGGFMAVPLERLGYEYVAVNYWSDQVEGATLAEVGLVATEANTDIVIELKPGKQVGVLFDGAVYQSDDNNLIRVSLGAFETVQLQASGDLTGSRIYSTKRIAVFSGNVDTTVFSSSSDHIIEQLLPVGALGSTYNVVPLPGRTGERYHVIALEEETSIYIGFSNDARQGFLQNVGDVYENSIFSATQIRADKEVMLVQYSVAQFETDAQLRGEPAMLLLPPEENYKTAHYFAVPAPETSQYTAQLILVSPDTGLTNIYVDDVVVPLSAWNEGASIDNNRYYAILDTEAGFHRAYSTDGSRFSVVVTGYVETQCAFSYPAGMCLEHTLVVS